MSISREHLIYGALAIAVFGGVSIALLVPSLGVSGGDNSNNLLVISLAAFVFAFFIHSDASARSPGEIQDRPIILPRLFLILAGLFVAALFASIFVAYDIHSALLSALEWTLAVLMMIIAAYWVQIYPKSIEGIALCMVLGGTLLSIIGLFTFTDYIGYLHLTSVLPEHNPFGGYVSMLIPISFVLSMSKRSHIRTLCTAATILLSTAFVLTFSRGSWLCFAGAIVVGLLLYRKEVAAIYTRNIIPKTILIVAATAVLSIGMYILAQEVGRIESATSTIYSSHVVPTDSTLDRLYYFKAALQVIELHPFGVGMGNYPVVAQSLRTEVLRFAFDPHNIYLRMVAEVGIIGGLLFIVLLLYAYAMGVLNISRAAWRDVQERHILSAISIGLLAEFVHSAIDFDLNYPLVIFTVFILLGVLYGSTVSKVTYKNIRLLSEREARLVLGGVVACIVVITALFILEFVGNQHRISGDNLVAQKKYAAALPYYQKAELFDPIASAAYINESEVYYTFASSASGDARTHLVGLALSKLQKALSYNTQSPDALSDEAYVYELQNDKAAALEAMKRSVAADPTNNLDRHVHLLSLYIDTHDYDSAMALIQTTVQKFPPELFTNYQYSDPLKEQWKKDIIIFLKVQKALYTVQKQPALAAAAEASILKYEAIP